MFIARDPDRGYHGKHWRPVTGLLLGGFTVLPTKRAPIDDLRRGANCPTWIAHAGAASRCMPGACLATPNLSRLHSLANRVPTAALRHFAHRHEVVIGTEQTAPSVAHPWYLAPVKFAGGHPVGRGLCAQGGMNAVGNLSCPSQRAGQHRASPGVNSSHLSQWDRDSAEHDLTVPCDAPLVITALVAQRGPSSVPESLRS